MPKRLQARKKGEVAFSNVQKVFFPRSKTTKGDVIRYYIEAAGVLLPHFRNRPVTLIRFPDGVHGEQFYEKNAPGFTPAWVQTAPVPRSEGGVINYILINDAPTLAWVANLAAIELHPFLHRKDNIDRPTHIAFDLDPGDGADLATCIEVGFMIREVLAGLKLQAFPKVSGSKGLQLYVPLNTPVSYALTKPFALTVAQLLERQHPDLIISDMAKVRRKKKVFIDWSQNDDKKTTVGPYSLRAKREEPFVSMPVTWEELKQHRRDISALFFSPSAALERIRKRGDLFAPVLKLKQKLPPGFVAAAPKAPKLRSPRAPHSLARYAEKRDFTKTAEPAPLPTRSSQGSRRRFVIQKHAASHLHFDFRLEMDDTLKSWAVPKGLPYEPGVKRSAFQTEDHPLEYLDFEGTIPAGQYGGGTVMVWDIGTYDLIGGNYWHGDLKLFLFGRKLKGEWHIFRIKSSEEKPVWLIQKAVEPMKPLSARQEDQSVLTKRSLAQIAAANDRQWQSNREPRPEASTPVAPTPALPQAGQWRPAAPARAKPAKTRAAALGRTTAKKLRRSTAPEPPAFVVPMAARQVSELPADAGWIYEIKWDGYRALGWKHGPTVRLISRNEKDLTPDFTAPGTALGQVPAESVLLDGEIVALEADGRPSFQALQHRSSSPARIVFYVYDLLYLDGTNWRERPLRDRKARLAKLLAPLAPEGALRLSANLEGRPAAIVTQIQQLGLEGIVAKREASTYQSGERSGDWVKLKFSPEQEFVVGGYKPGSPIESLVVGTYDGKKLLCAGKVRQGLNPRRRAELARLLHPLETDICPFANLPNSTKSHWGEGITVDQMSELRWVKPKIVAQISFAEWTRGGNLRHGTFKGLRHDKAAADVVREAT
jgi:bifunctional non-homologous end joining protein LigD